MENGGRGWEGGGDKDSFTNSGGGGRGGGGKNTFVVGRNGSNTCSILKIFHVLQLLQFILQTTFIIYVYCIHLVYFSEKR